MSRRRKKRRQATETRFASYDRRYVITLLILAAVALVAAGAILIYLNFPLVGLTLTGGGASRATSEPPRSIDIWMANPDGTLRFATVFHPAHTAVAGPERVTVAGPLVRQAEDIIAAEVFGGEIHSEEYQRGPGHDSSLIYDLYSLNREGNAPYGLDVTFQNPPYRSSEKGVQIVSFGAEPQPQVDTEAGPAPYYRQVIVAVAFPEGTTIRRISEMAPYRWVRMRGWMVFYFDTTALEESEVIRFRYVPGPSAEPLSWGAVDAGR